MSDAQADRDAYARGLGAILGNLQSLEYAIRAFLLDCEPREVLDGFASEEYVVGNFVSLNPFTNYDTLLQLIRKYNAKVEPSYPDFCIDESVSDLRDALAHGRVAALQPSFPFILVKFNNPRHNETGDKVKVTHNELITREWLSTNTKRVADQVKKIIAAAEAMGMQVFPRE